MEVRLELLYDEYSPKFFRRLAEELIRRVVRGLPDVRHMPKYRWYYFYRGRETIRSPPAEEAVGGCQDKGRREQV
ncbi:hypothetical protein DRO24_04130 [Candidatus Bathyarchaeota archaeon]|nr:MAG: hypothetical protein DRO24_04130 [Candidatus Bathyarchaeota archaeon]